MQFNTINKNDHGVHRASPVQIRSPPVRSSTATNAYPNTNSKKIVPDVVEPELPSKKITWGEPTWFLFHTLAHKVKDSAFSKVRNELLNIIFLICNNLPCPDCATHATRYLQGINFDAILTKQQLKDMLFNFHNSVNMKKGYTLYPKDQLDAKYSSANTLNIINNFYYYFDKKQNNLKLSASGFHRTRTIQRMKVWIYNNLSNFDP